MSEEPVAARPGVAEGGGGVGARRGSAQQGPRRGSREALRAGSLLPGACLSPETESSENAVPFTGSPQREYEEGLGQGNAVPFTASPQLQGQEEGGEGAERAGAGVVDAAPATSGSQTGADAGMGACCSACEYC
jgi:hypothetical protein